MSDVTLDEVWQKRFNSLQARITALSNQLKSIPIADQQPDVDRQDSLQTLTDGLSSFADAMFDYFYKGFDSTHTELTLKISSEYPVDQVLTRILEPISYDLEAIQWAFEQRRHADTNMQWALQVGDKLAWEALQPALHLFDLPEDTTVLVYFQKFPEVRVIPYASVALIGLPITCVPVGEEGNRQIVARDFLAIPHEVAHYVYWHGRTKKADETESRPIYEAITADIAPQMAWGQEWLEELFADVYGALIAGPLIAQSFQDLQMRLSQERFLSDDGAHPTPFIRPDIYTKVVRKKQGKAWADALNTRWQAKRDSRVPNNPSLQIRYGRTGESKKPTKMISLVDSYDNDEIEPQRNTPIDIAVNALFNLMSTMNNTLWQEPIALAVAGQGAVQQEPAVNVDKLYPEFEKWVLDILNRMNGAGMPSNSLNEVEDLVRGKIKITTWESEGRGKARQKAVQDALRTGTPESNATNEANARFYSTDIPPSVWWNVLHAGGWGTKGPETNPVGD